MLPTTEPTATVPVATEPPAPTVQNIQVEPTLPVTYVPNATLTQIPTPTLPPTARPASEEDSFCYRTPTVQRAILRDLQSSRCIGITAAELFRFENISSIESVQFQEGDFDWLVNLRDLLITGGHKDAPLPPGLFQELQSVVNATLATAGVAQSGLLSGLQNAQRLELTLGNNVNSSNTILDEDEIDTQRELPVDLLCDMPKLEELHLRFAGIIPDGFFDCVPELRILGIENYDKDSGTYNAANYRLNLSRLHKLEELRVPETPHRNDGRRRVILSDKSPVLVQASRYIRSDGPTSCPNYISDGSWIMCVSVTARQ